MSANSCGISCYSRFLNNAKTLRPVYPFIHVRVHTVQTRPGVPRSAACLISHAGLTLIKTAPFCLWDPAAIAHKAIQHRQSERCGSGNYFPCLIRYGTTGPSLRPSRIFFISRDATTTIRAGRLHLAAIQCEAYNRDCLRFVPGRRGRTVGFVLRGPLFTGGEDENSHNRSYRISARSSVNRRRSRLAAAARKPTLPVQMGGRRRARFG